MTSLTLPLTTQAWRTKWRTGELTNQHVLAFLVIAYVLAAIALDPVAYWFVFSKKLLKVTNALVVPFVIYTFIVSRGVLSGKHNSLIDAHRSLKLSLNPVIYYFTLFTLGLSAFTIFKLHIPIHMPFYLDHFFADLDKAIHGVDPWILTHSIPRFPFFDGVMHFIYSGIWFISWFGTFVAVALWKNREGRNRYMWGMALTTLICGSILATLLSSVGPIFYERFYGDDRFAELTDYLMQNWGMMSVYQMSTYLYSHYVADVTVLGGGISAMPSMHVAISVLNAWFLTSLGKRPAIAGWTFAAIIMFGSVYTGWHYALDGYLSFIVVTAIWFGVSYFVGPDRKSGIGQEKKAPAEQAPSV
jgi:hypothetical protein